LRVDLYTDASIKGGRGAWAAVLLREGERSETSGPLRGSFLSSSSTELCAIANALHWARKAGLIMPGDEVKAWCDNTNAVDRVNGIYVNRNKTDRRLIDATRWIRDYRKEHRFELRSYHIKGHQRLDSGDPQAIYNQRCDELCSAIRDNVEATPFALLETRVGLARARAERRAKRKAA
jgi:ribonuclease HI